MNHPLRRLFTLLAALAMVLAACGDDDSAGSTVGEADTSTRTYQNGLEGFSLDVPADWLVVGNDADSFADIADQIAQEGSQDFFPEAQFEQLVAQGAVLFAFAVEDGGDEFLTNVNILKFPRGPNDSADALLTGNVADIEGVGGVVSTSEIVALPSGEAIHLLFDIDVPGLGPLTTEQYLIFADQSIFVLTLTSSDFGAVAGVADAMAESFRLD